MSVEALDDANAVPMERRRFKRYYSANPGKRATERYWLWYTLVWGAAAGAVMLSGAANSWGDLELLPFAVLLAAGAVLGPILLRPPAERTLPLHRTASMKLVVSVVGFAFLLNYSQTPFFFDVLHMHFGFRTLVNIRNNPVALYILTIPYFATYCAICLIGYRFVRHVLRGARRVVQLLAIAVLPFGIAFLETALNANPFTRQLFCYDDMTLMLWFGTFAYGTAFCFALPVWLHIDEQPNHSVGLAGVVISVAAAVYGDSLMLDLYRHHLAPHVTHVVEGAQGLRDYGRGCLQER